eukprot:2708746-Pyramimonas_sp.AAC.1
MACRDVLRASCALIASRDDNTSSVNHTLQLSSRPVSLPPYVCVDPPSFMDADVVRAIADH